MNSPHTVLSDPQRLAALATYQVLDTPPAYDVWGTAVNTAARLAQACDSEAFWKRAASGERQKKMPVPT